MCFLKHHCSLEAETRKVSREEIEALFMDIDFLQYVNCLSERQKDNLSEKGINQEPSKHKINRLIRPEERGEDYTVFSSRQLLDKLKNGDKIEQRKAANALWERFGSKADMMNQAEKEMIAERTKGYLAGIKTDFEENTMQIQRLWHLAFPSLLANVAHEDVSISENAASLLSVMKTPQILEEVIAASNEAKSADEISKYIFALEYMKINNPYFVKNRTRMSDSECENYSNEKITPQIMVLKQRLQNIKQMSGHDK